MAFINKAAMAKKKADIGIADHPLLKELGNLSLVEKMSYIEGCVFASLMDDEKTDDAERARAVGLMEQAGAIDAVRAKAHELVATAKEQLPEGLVDDAARETLLSMADFFVERAG